jgi:hypothetical protein
MTDPGGQVHVLDVRGVQSVLGRAYRFELAAGATVVDSRRPWVIRP